MEADVIVIGGGMAGSTAALKAASHGANVLLIRKGNGSTAMSSGTIDIAGPEKFLPLDNWDASPLVADRLKDILRVNPLHPYSLIAGGRNGLRQLCARIQEACSFVIEHIPQLQMQGSSERNLALPNILGTVKFSSYACRSLFAGNFADMRDAHILLVGISGLMLFQPRICRQTLARNSSLHSPRAIASVETLEIVVPEFMSALPSAPFEVAHHLDEPRAAEQLARAIARNIPAGTTHVAFPPILGLDNHPQVYEILSREIRQKIFELISPNYSVPGYRLQRALEAALRKQKVRIATGDVIDAKRDGRNVRNLIVKVRTTTRAASAKKYVLASGKFSSGGIVANDSPIEPIFGLPLFCRDMRVDNRFIQDLLNWNVESKQLFLSCGVHTDRQLHPLDASGEPAYENLYAAGSIIGEYDYIADKCGLGVAILSGFVAGEQAVS